MTEEKLLEGLRNQDPEALEALILQYYYYLQTSAQIGKALGMSAGAVRARLMRGRETLKRTLWKEEIQ